MRYTNGAHTKYHTRYHLVWITKYRYKILTKEMRLRIRELTRQICEQLGATIVSGVLSNNHVHLFVQIPPKVSVSDFMRRVKRLHLAQAAAGVPRTTQALLGPALLGERATSAPPQA